MVTTLNFLYKGLAAVADSVTLIFYYEPGARDAGHFARYQ